MQACLGVVRPGAVLWQAHRGELRRGSTGGGVPAPGMAYVPRHLVQKVKGVAGLLTELELDGGSGAEASTVMSRGGAQSCSRCPGSRVALRASGPHRKPREAPANAYR